MAYISYGLNRGENSKIANPYAITLGTDDGGAGNNVTLCIDKTKSLTTREVVEICMGFIRRLEDGKLGTADILNI